MGKLVTAREAAGMTGRSRSQINRDAASGKLPVAQQFPGATGPRLFDADVVAEVYEENARRTS